MKRRNEPKIEEVNDVLSTSSGKKYSRAEWRMSIGMMLNNEHLRGDVILLAISMERHLDSFLADYFCRVGRLLEFHEGLLPMLGFSQKIELLRKLYFRKSIKSQSELCRSYNMLRRLRNHCAHAHHFDGPAVARLADDQHIREFMAEYPDSVVAFTRRTARLFSALRRTKEFVVDGDVEPDIPW